MLFTIAIGVFNGEAYINECLKSLTKSVTDNSLVEILIVDDGSVDRTVEIAQEYEKSYPNVRIVKKEKNKGSGDNYNIAVKKALGDYIFFMDGDDVIEIELLEKTVKNIDLTGDLLAFRHYKFRDNGEIVYNNKPFNLEVGKIYSFMNVRDKISLFIHDLAYNRNFLIENNIKADDAYKLYNDMSFNMRIFQRAKTIQCFDANIYGYRFSDGQSMSIKSLIKWRMDRISMSKSMINEYFKVKNEETDPDRIKMARVQAAGSFADAYMGALFGNNVKNEIAELNQFIRQDISLWNSASKFAKITRWNIPVLYPFLRIACKYHFKYVLNNFKRKF